MVVCPHTIITLLYVSFHVCCFTYALLALLDQQARTPLVGQAPVQDDEDEEMKVNSHM